MRLLREPWPPFSACTVRTNLKNRRGQRVLRNLKLLKIRRPQAGRTPNFSPCLSASYLRILSGDGVREGHPPAELCLVCHSQERGTLLSQFPRRSSPAVAFRDTSPVKVFLPGLFSLFLGGCGLIPRIELPVSMASSFRSKPCRISSSKASSPLRWYNTKSTNSS